MATSKPYPEQETSPANQSGKVAEAVSPYITRSETERATLRHQPELRYIAGLPASDEVWRFAQENALVPHVETAVRLAREHFKEIREIKLTYSPDPEIPHWETIAIDLHVTGTMDELLQADKKYTRAFNTTIPDEYHLKITPLLWGAVKEK